MTAPTDLTPWLLGHGAWCEIHAARAPGGAAVFDVLDPSTLPFFHLVNAGNALAYGGHAMPAWVQLDCACLPAGMVGFGVARADVDDALWSRLVTQVEQGFGREARAATERWQGLVPLSEYACVPTPAPGEVVGFSLYSLRPGLGVRTKALGLLVADAVRQTGVAQVDNSALSTHTALGPLEVVAPRVLAHSRPDTTFVYRLQLDDRTSLQAIARGLKAPPRRAGTMRLAVDTGTTTALAALIHTHGRQAIVDVEREEHAGSTRPAALVLAPMP